MENIKRFFTLARKDITFKRIILAFFRRLANIPQFFLWKLPFGFAEENRNRLAKYKDIHAGKRVFIIANGPSLKYVDFGKLKNEITIGMNRIYLMKEVNGFVPTYLVCIDKKSQTLQFTDDYDNIDFPAFYNWDLRNVFKHKNRHIFLKEKLNPKFSKDLVKEPYGSGKTVTYACIQLAYFMGFDEVYLIGKDHTYNTDEKVGVPILSDGNEENHFIKGYYKPNMTWDAPDLKSEEYAYRIAKRVFEYEKKIIKDATINGQLNVFEKVDLSTLLYNSEK
ncbi:MAG: DUF115 domain-containing protein [Firmicutes bacterium]|nr:DUF115 domain-containing protein [Bacillota bacterium]